MFSIDPVRVQSNMVLLDFTKSSMRASQARDLLAAEGVMIGMGMGDMLRAVLHIDLDDDAVDRASDIFHRVF